MKIAAIIVRVLMGLGFIVFGLNILHPFLPQPPPVEGSLPAQFFTVMATSQWMKLIGFFQLLGGTLVLIGRTAPMGLMILGPILVNILAYHIFLDKGQDMAPGFVFTFFELFLIYAYRNHFRSVFTTSATPAV
jgi:putative oxidoreductase